MAHTYTSCTFDHGHRYASLRIYDGLTRNGNLRSLNVGDLRPDTFSCFLTHFGFPSKFTIMGLYDLLIFPASYPTYTSVTDIMCVVQVRH